jgi:chemotaxis protein CheX
MAHLDREIVDVVETVCSSVLGFEVVETRPPTAPPPPGMIAHTLVAGAWSGSVVVWCDDGFADACAAVLFEGEPCGPPEARDALGELTNIIAGNLKALLPAPSRLSIPIVASGGAPPCAPSGGDLDRVYFEVSGRHRLEVVLREARDAGTPGSQGPVEV